MVKIIRMCDRCGKDTGRKVIVLSAFPYDATDVDRKNRGAAIGDFEICPECFDELKKMDKGGLNNEW